MSAQPWGTLCDFCLLSSGWRSCAARWGISFCCPLFVQSREPLAQPLNAALKFWGTVTPSHTKWAPQGSLFSPTTSPQNSYIAMQPFWASVASIFHQIPVCWEFHEVLLFEAFFPWLPLSCTSPSFLLPLWLQWDWPVRKGKWVMSISTFSPFPKAIEDYYFPSALHQTSINFVVRK